MSVPTCPELQAWADLLHSEARLSVEAASSRGAAGDGFLEQIVAAARCEKLADVLEQRVAEDC